MHRILVFLEKIDLERQDRKQFIYIALDIFDAIFLPSPNLRRNIIADRYLRMLFDIFGYLQVKSRIINKDQHIRLPRFNILLAVIHVTENSTQVKQYGNKTHICQFTVMLYASTSHRLHQIASEKAKFDLRIFVLQGTHQVRCVQVARCLSYYQIIFHTFQFQCFKSSISEYAVTSICVGVIAT